MKQIDDNQLRIINYLLDQIVGTNEDLLPLISWRKSRDDAYLAAVAKLKTTGIIETSYDGHTVTYSLTKYGKDQFG